MDKPPVDIVRLGAQGDGIAGGPDGVQYVPSALPGERVRPRDAALPELMSAPSPERRAPICQHFGMCGGCVAQHMSAQLYARWKRGILVAALLQHGLEPPVGELMCVAPGTRRRAVLTARRTDGKIVLGYHRRATHDLIDLVECPVLRTTIVARLPALRAIAGALDADELRLTVLDSLQGLDVSIAGAGGALDARSAARIAAMSTEHGIARLAIDGEVVAERARPQLPARDAYLLPPPGAFVQAVADAEQAMVARVLTAVGKAKRIADLFAGIGTFTLPLARQARVLAVDSDWSALAGLADAARNASRLKPIETKLRDLSREPLSPKELEEFDAAVLDPPRAGAKAQAEQLARTSLTAIVYVSCSPANLARDVRILVDGGYSIESVMPIDQFLFSAHLEAVAVLRRDKKRRKHPGAAYAVPLSSLST
jgi:23S rRNA (uracil1939-C5)-methyltransferase